MVVDAQLESRELDRPQYIPLSSNDFQLIPYAKVNGEWTVPDSFVVSAYLQMMNEGNADTVFIDGSVENELEFLESMKRKSNVVVFVIRAGELLGVAWLNGWYGNAAYGHFCLMREASKSLSTTEIGNEIIRYWLSFPTVEFILGVVPAFNKLAINFVQSIGFKRVGAIPGMMNGLKGRSAAVIFYTTED